MAHGLHTLAGVVALFGLIGLYVRQMDESGKLGLIAFIVAFVGSALFAGLGMITEFIVSVVADEAPELFDKGGAMEDPGKLPIIPLTIIIFIVGFILMGIATFRARVLPCLPSVTLIIGIILFFPPLPWPIPVIGSVLFGASLAWMGYELWRQPADMATEAQPAT